MKPDIDAERLQADIETTASFGAVDTDVGRGRTVLPGTDANREAREYLVSRFEAAELDVTIDAVGNIVGTWTPASAMPEAAPVAAGSHLDSVPEGGIFDGPLGVYAALESVRAMQDAGVEPTQPIAVVSFTGEEGSRFGDGLLGSSVATGKEPVDDVLARTDSDGVTLETALADIGYQGDGRIHAGAWDAWLELHVEQSKRLDAAGVPAGVVTTITGISRCEVSVQGEANHAGATPMGERTDALTAASEFVLEIEQAANEIVSEESNTAVGTVGKLDVEPNATNVVPGQVELGVDVRDIKHDMMDLIVAEAEAVLSDLEREREVDTTLDRPFDLAPTPMDARCRDVLHAAGDAAEIETLDLHSGAAHDTMHLADVTDAGLLFAPSRDGISHNPREWTDWEDCAAATQVLAGALARLAT